jgi:predicted DCC family thiol-disulfide oxidoreductase YuxK/ribosomal protein S18 acetylase RimI-like enzyme
MEPRIGSLIVLYDGECGFCKVVMGVLLSWDRAGRLRPAAIQSTRAERLLADIERERRLDSWHVIDAAGVLRSGGAGIPVLCAALPGGTPFGRLASRFPTATSRVYEWMAEHRVLLGRAFGERSRSWAAGVIAERERADPGARQAPTVPPSPSAVVPCSLVWATDIDVLPLDHTVERRDGYLIVRSPGHPTHYWGNLLLFDDPPAAGDAARWEAVFEAEFGGDPQVQHRTFAWDRVDGTLGAAREEFASREYEIEEMVGLVGTPEIVHAHARANRDVKVRALDPRAGADEELWAAVVELQIASRDERFTEESFRDYVERRQDDLRAVFRLGRGAWYVALDGPAGEVVGSCGVVVTDTRGRFQAVDTAAAHRRRGVCSRLVVDAARDAAAHHGARHLVIAADPDYHALGLYESLGFRRREHVSGACRPPPASRAGDGVDS